MAEKSGRRGHGGEKGKEREQAPDEAAAPPEQEAAPEERNEERKEKGARGPSAASSLESVVDKILELPFGAQLGLLRSVAPRVIAMLDGRDRETFLRQLHNEIELARRGEDEERSG
jgi:hypothetical protein